MAHALNNMMVFTGNANPALAAGVAKQLGIQLGKADVSKFSDGEVAVEINENVRAKMCSCCNRHAHQPTTT